MAGRADAYRRLFSELNKEKIDLYNRICDRVEGLACLANLPPDNMKAILDAIHKEFTK